MSPSVTTYLSIWPVEATADRQDVGGQDKIRPLWRHYYTGTQVCLSSVDLRRNIFRREQELITGTDLRH